MYARLSVALLAACGSRGASQDPPAPSTPPTPTETETLGVLYERLTIDRESSMPLFGPDGSVTVGAQR